MTTNYQRDALMEELREAMREYHKTGYYQWVREILIALKKIGA